MGLFIIELSQKQFGKRPILRLHMTKNKDWKYLVMSPRGANKNALKFENPNIVNDFIQNISRRDALKEVKAVNLDYSILIIIDKKEDAELLIKQKFIPLENGDDIPIKIVESKCIKTKNDVSFCDQLHSMTDKEIVAVMNNENPDINNIVSIWSFGNGRFVINVAVMLHQKELKTVFRQGFDMF